MAKYAIRKLELPEELIDVIYSFIDPCVYIKNLPSVWFKRLVDKSIYYYPDDKSNHPFLTKHYLKSEGKLLDILVKNKAYNLIRNHHLRNLQL
jgi:hypothetical protein